MSYAGVFDGIEICRQRVLLDVAAERRRQHAKFGDQAGMDRMFMLAVLGEEVGEACRAAIEIEVDRRNFRAEYPPSVWSKWTPTTAESARLRSELVQVAAVAVQMIEHIDREAEA